MQGMNEWMWMEGAKEWMWMDGAGRMDVDGRGRLNGRSANYHAQHATVLVLKGGGGLGRGVCRSRGMGWAAAACSRLITRWDMAHRCCLSREKHEAQHWAGIRKGCGWHETCVDCGAATKALTLSPLLPRSSFHFRRS
jgi:hypothetical protein